MGVSSFDARCTEAVRRLSAVPHLSILVGAGASVAAGLPSWDQLVRRLIAEDVADPQDASELARLLVETQGYLLAAEAAFPADANPEKRREKIKRVLYRGVANPVPSRLQQAVAQLVTRLRGSKQLEVFTTNYDDLLEQALGDELEEGIQCMPRWRWFNPPRPEVMPVHHIHGYLGTDESSDDVVLGSIDYDRVAQASSDWPGEELGACLAKGPILFVGTSLTDPNLLRILAKLRNRQETGSSDYTEHALILARQGLGVEKRLEERFRERLQALWKRYQVQVILLDDFSDISLFLREMAWAPLEYPSSPAERVARLHEAVMGRFDELQREFHQTLREDVEGHLGDLIGGEERTLSLWLTDGSGQVKLFGSSSRIHGDPEELKVRRDDHEDGWVTPEAMASEGTRVKPPRGNEAGKHGKWRTVGAAPLQPALAGGPPLTAGALSFGTTRPWSQKSRRSFLEAGSYLEEELAAQWEDRLARVVRD